jgi:5,10-methylenetetrahydromethanopterin reductase
MDFGIVVATSADSWKVVQRAEELGFSHAWFYDTQMLCADCFVAMGAAAMKTSRIRLGTGVLVPSNRIAPVTANAFATLNKLAPGRIDFGVGTGFTARRAMGMDAIKLAELAEYIRVVYALLREETVEAEFEGQRRKIRFLNPELGLINTKDPIALHVSAYGPKARAFAAKMGAGWLNFVGDLQSACTQLEDFQAARACAGHGRSSASAVAFSVGCVLEPGEPYDSPRALAQAGARAALYLHRAADEALAGLRNSSPTDPSVQQAVHGYIELARGFQPQDARYLTNHRGHLLFVRPEEHPFVTADLMRTATFTATEQELIERIAAMRDAGYTQFAVQITPGQESAIEDWARIKDALRRN